MTKSLQISFLRSDIAVDDFDSPKWETGSSALISQYWSGKEAPIGRHTTARVLWTDEFLYAKFDASQVEPLVVSDRPDTSKKVIGLWETDVCEIFIAPNKTERNKYFEFEIAPTGEWIDLAIEATPIERNTDWDYESQMEAAARIDTDKVVMAIKIPFSALGKTPKAGDVWLGNLFRCVGKGETRGYLAWSPTKTERPNFHVPEAFGEFKFVK